MDGIASLPEPQNEPVLDHAPGSPERAALERALREVAAEPMQVPAVIGGERIETGRRIEVRAPHDHDLLLAVGHEAGAREVQRAIEAAEAARAAWAAMPFEARAAIFLRAADELSGPMRARIDAITMLAQSKTIHQAEIDAVCELADFLRFNVWWAERIQRTQPERQPRGVWNRMDYRPLDGFVFAVTPFNFLSIAVNLPTAPAIMGNTVVWKPSTATLPGSLMMLEVLERAGLPPGVINLVPGAGPEQGEAALDHPALGGIHFTGSVPTFQWLWQRAAQNLPRYRCFPRIVGETGGKDFALVHPSADLEAVVTAVVRGGYEFQGQKCSALSRLYVPASLWPRLRERLADEIAALRVGDPTDFSNFLGAVVDERAWNKITGYLQLAKEEGEIIVGGRAEREPGWFVWPTLVRLDDPRHRLMQEEIFGPIVSVHVYEDARWEETLRLVDTTSPYGLTGAVFARDRAAIVQATERLRHAAGNFYVNDKPTGAVVAQQPFGGSRKSGTNDKAGSLWNLIRWTSPRCVKENLLPPTDWRYPFLEG